MIGGALRQKVSFVIIFKGENVSRFPSMPKGEIVEYIVFIDVKGVHG